MILIYAICILESKRVNIFFLLKPSCHACSDATRNQDGKQHVVPGVEGNVEGGRRLYTGQKVCSVVLSSSVFPKLADGTCGVCVCERFVYPCEFPSFLWLLVGWGWRLVTAARGFLFVVDA